MSSPLTFNPANWYWGPDGSGNYFASASLTMVPASNAALQAWLATGNKPTLFVNLATIRAVLIQSGLSKRTIPDIFTSLNALTASQKVNINTALFTGTPWPVLTDTGRNCGAIVAMYALAQTATLSAADITLLKLYATAMYVQDNPSFLAQPGFDPTINVLGTTF